MPISCRAVSACANVLPVAWWNNAAWWNKHGKQLKNQFAAGIAPSTNPSSWRLLQFYQDLEPIWVEFPDDPEAATTGNQVAMTLRDVPTRAARRAGACLATWTPDSEDFMIMALRIYPCPDGEPLTPEIWTQWLLDSGGLSIDLWVNGHAAASVLPRPFSALTCTRWPFAITGSASWAQRAACWLHRFVWWLFRRTPPLDGALAMSTVVKKGDRLAIHARFPPGWKPSRKWRVGILLGGLVSEAVH